MKQCQCIAASLTLMLESLVTPTATSDPTTAAPKAERSSPSPRLEETRSCRSTSRSFINCNMNLSTRAVNEASKLRKVLPVTGEGPDYNLLLVESAYLGFHYDDGLQESLLTNPPNNYDI